MSEFPSQSQESSPVGDRPPGEPPVMESASTAPPEVQAAEPQPTVVVEAPQAASTPLALEAGPFGTAR
jgi:hypothetical protein